ncbi:HV349 protein, partial [Sakesphorus luctuosus]|nr:HV349 protein [Sakesphorus luctuosus]
GLLAQWRLQEDGGGLRAPGQSVRLSCRGSGITFENYYIRWYRQAPGGSLEWVSLFNSPLGTIQKYGAAVEGRASAFWDSSKFESYLSLWALQSCDSARYFCAVHTG